MEEIKDSATFKKLLKIRDDIEKDAISFNEQWKKFLTSHNSDLSIILKCHLIVEHFLNEFISSCNPAIQDIERARLSFAQKLSLADHPNTVVRLIMPGLKALNKIRNHYAHKLDLTVDDLDLNPIHEFMKIWKEAGGYPVPKGMDLILEFTMFASSNLHGTSQMIKRYGKGKGLQEYLEMNWEE